ncbi:MAG: DUF6151 family protein [Lysobacter sp.]
MTIPFRCRCGTLQGEIEPAATYLRAVCYCRDCQAFARALDREQDVLDPNGGTDIVAIRPAGVRFTMGREQVACLSLSPKGLLRWHSACCHTPLANTPRDPKLPYVGVLVSCMAGESGTLDAAFGARRIALGTGSARGEVAATPVRTTLGVVRIMWGVLRAKLGGRDRDNPFFDMATLQPVVEPRVLTRQERAEAEGR